MLRFKSRYVTLSHLGSGTYGDVYKIEDVVTKKQWADKKIKIGDRVTVKDGVNRSAYAEILAMRELNHVRVLLSFALQEREAVCVFVLWWWWCWGFL